jgi:phosphoadenosine phosphosulfate reductase
MEPTTAISPPVSDQEKLHARFDEEAVAGELESMSASEVLEWAFSQFGQDMYIACSFQKTSSVVMQLATEINPQARFFYLDTDVLFPETYETRDRLAEHFNVEFERWHNITLEEQAAEFGDKLWNRDPDACCGLRKVEPMRRALGTVDAWVAGVRRADSATRAKTRKLAWDKKFNIWKLNPIADWSERDVWNHLNEHNVPYNPLHDQGYPSIGCTHCTRPVVPGQSARDGRWSGSGKTECGIN